MYDTFMSGEMLARTPQMIETAMQAPNDMNFLRTAQCHQAIPMWIVLTRRMQQIQVNFDMFGFVKNQAHKSLVFETVKQTDCFYRETLQTMGYRTRRPGLGLGAFMLV